MKKTFFAIIILSQFSMVSGLNYQSSWKSLDSRPIPAWFEDAKFGIFIHWGIYSVPAWRKLENGKYASYAEWYCAKVMYNDDNGGREFHKKNYGENFEYRDFAPLFKAELFDPIYWADLFKKSGAKYVALTSKQLILELIDIVSRGGNLLLNIGPRSDGTIPVVMQERLLDIGKWLDVNGEAIYKTRKRAVTSQQNKDQELYFTRKGDSLFCIFTKWSKTFEIKLLPGENVKNIRLLGYTRVIQWILGGNHKLIIQIPRLTIDEIPCLTAWALKIDLIKQ